MFKEYFKNILKTLKPGDAREESFYPALKIFIENLSEFENKKISVTLLPKKHEGQSPDFRIREGNKIIGYIEAKDFQKHSDDLDEIEDSNQLKRYKKAFPNLILTNFFEFRLYRKGILADKVRIGRPFISYELKVVPPVENEKKFISLISEFFAFSIPEIKKPKELAIELGNRTHFLKEKILEEIKNDNSEIIGFYQAFKKHLIINLTEDQFADLYAQTITYGLFTARTRTACKEFRRETAVKFIPQSIPLLKKIFAFISSEELPKSMEWIVDEISQVLAVANISKIIKDFYKKGKGTDPIIHFYETFLGEYDPKEREKRGVYYTPEPVVSYIVRSVNQILKEKFNKKDGFATSSVTVLDPAAGTLTFPAEAIKLAKKEIQKKYGPGIWQSTVKGHILKNFYAFELLMAPYVIGHLKISLLLEELGYKMRNDDKFNFYLTNTLENEAPDPNQFPGIFERVLAKESEQALEVKEKIPIMVVMGNPPYSGVSENKGDWILEQIKEYRQIRGKPLGERKDWLQDDYVKFFRFAQWKIEKLGTGILGFITNHAWIDNPTFRGMRYSLMKTFDEIYILNLHGSVLKKEKTPEGQKDENVFDIQPGVAITICIKHQEKIDEKKVLYAELWGLRGDINKPKTKYYYLNKNDVKSTKWQPIIPKKPYYFFVPKSEKGHKEYDKFWKITNIFPINSTGIVTAHDHFAIDFKYEELKNKISAFKFSPHDDNYVKKDYQLKENYAWRVSKARYELKQVDNWQNYFTKILYRPFDERWIYYHSSVVWRVRKNVMKHMLKQNLALTTCRQQSIAGFQHVLVTNLITESCYVSNRTKEIGYVFPLYLYSSENKQQTILDGQEKLDLKGAQHKLKIKKEKEPNINPELFDALKSCFDKEPTPEEIFYYIYGTLYSNTYRKKYEEFLKIDFPKVPFTKDYKLFKKISKLGEELVNLHLLKSPKLNKPLAKFYGKNDNSVKIRKYDKNKRRIYINEKQYFEPINKEIWEYMIGGYQVLDKWLKYKKGETLSTDDIKHYCRIATTLVETIKIQKEIDNIYPEIEKKLINS